MERKKIVNIEEVRKAVKQDKKKGKRRCQSNPKQVDQEYQAYQQQLNADNDNHNQKQYLKGRSTFTELFHMKKIQQQQQNEILYLKTKLAMIKTDGQDWKDQYQKVNDKYKKLRQKYKLLQSKVKVFEENEDLLNKKVNQFKGMAEDCQYDKKKFRKMVKQDMDQMVQDQKMKFQEIIDQHIIRENEMQLKVEELQRELKSSKKQNMVVEQQYFQNKENIDCNRQQYDEKDYYIHYEDQQQLIDKYKSNDEEMKLRQLIHQLEEKLNRLNKQDRKDKRDLQEMMQIEKQLRSQQSVLQNH